MAKIVTFVVKYSWKLSVLPDCYVQGSMKIVITKIFALYSLHLHFQIPITKMDTDKM